VFWIDVGLLKSADVEIKNMNEGKVGEPFRYSDIHIHRQQQGHCRFAWYY
jgi:hypothetical protein